jgi:cation diffusion facilitator CzcD-associated flavoprotein CzcO
VVLASNWKWPSIPGINSFQGKLIHSAHWEDKSYSVTNRRIAIVGIGSSGIQIVPELAKIPGVALDIHARSQTWISPAPGINEPTENDPAMDAEYNFTEETLQLFTSDPAFLRDYRAALMDRRSSNFKRAIADSDLQTQAQDLFRKIMKERLGDTPKGRRAASFLLPSFPVGCRRLTPGPGGSSKPSRRRTSS